MFETAEKMIQVVSNTARRFVHEARDLAKGHRISEQKLN
jgi:hypothetical protein